MNVNEFSIAEFGSIVREDSDEWSDRDLLIVKSNSPNFDDSLLNEYLSNKEYSISYYNYEKLEFLSKIKNLFILHLKTESNILVDQTGRLSNILHDYQPKNNYIKEQQESEKYFNYLKYFPLNEIAQNCFLDCFFVGIRNYFVYKFANEYQYNFSFKKMVKQLKNDNLIDTHEASTLYELRKIKTIYRNNSSVKDAEEFLIKIQRILLKFGIEHKLNELTNKNLLLSIYNQIENDKLNSYQIFRLLEICYKSLDRQIVYLENIFTNPQFYTPKIRSKSYLNHLKETMKIAHNNI